MSLVVCKLPKAGLGNQLFPMMHAMVFAEINEIPLIIIGYHQIKIGPYLRKERKKRHYYGSFTFHKNILHSIIDKIKVIFYSFYYNVIREPDVNIYTNDLKKNKLFFFKKIPDISDYFFQLRPYRDLVKKLIIQSLNPAIRKSYQKFQIYTIGAHVRKGDFKKISSNEDFFGGHVRVPESYYTDTIGKLRIQLLIEDTVAIFTDGYHYEFSELLDLKNKIFIDNNSDILDLLQLSMCRYIITSPNSTFSYWASFLSNAWIIQHDRVQHNILSIELPKYKIDNLIKLIETSL